MISDLRLLDGSAPALLANILAINFAPDLGCDRTVEAGILWTIEVETNVLSAANLVDHKASPTRERVRKTVLLLQSWSGLSASMAMEGLNAGAGSEVLDMTRRAELVFPISDRLHRGLSMNPLLSVPDILQRYRSAQSRSSGSLSGRVKISIASSWKVGRSNRLNRATIRLATASQKVCIDPRNDEILDSREICASSHIALSSLAAVVAAAVE